MPELLRKEDIPEAAALLARAFRDNPGMLAIFDSDDPERRARLLARLTPSFVQSYAKHGLAHAVRAGERLAGVALILPAHAPTFALQAQLTLGVIRHMPPWIGLRLGVTDQILKRRHPHAAHHYLFMLGVDPELQGQGHGSRLLRALSQRADADGVVCYLETDKLSSVRLYANHGYSVTSEATLTPRKLQVWFMQRLASTSAREAGHAGA